MPQNGAHLADLLLFAHSRNAREQFLLRDADLYREFLVRLCNEWEFPLQQAHDLLVDLLDLDFFCHRISIPSHGYASLNWTLIL